ncbi:hypothetical protein AB9P05_08830 [Roseivirga sp. BDSF3-8]|uniref:hypothetical protein n=1 Tax=Roseivirga sp. BDSF3-8 TaxID=3241598 RepID=UPI00353237DE
MQSIISNMGTAYYDNVKNAVVFIFKEFSSIYAYRDSLDLAINLALNHKTNNWLFDKTKFSHAITTEVVMELLDWTKRCCRRLRQHEVYKDCKVSVITSSDAFTEHFFTMLNKQMNEKMTDHTEIAFFKDAKQAEGFLLTGTKSTLYQAG